MSTIRKPSKPVAPRVFGNFAAMVREINWLFMNPVPGEKKDASDPDDASWLGVGYNKLYVLVDLGAHVLYTNCVSNDQGEVCTTNYTETFDNFVVDGITGEIHLGTKLWVDGSKGIAVPFYKRP